MSTISLPGLGSSLRRRLDGLLADLRQVFSIGTVRSMPARTFAGAAVAIAISLLAAWILFFAFVLSGVQQHRANAVLYSQLREHLAEATSPIGGVIAPGTPIASMQIPRLRNANVVVEGTAPDNLTAGPGHRRNSPLPGQPGVAIVYGKSTTFGGPFARLSVLKPGDDITFTTGQGTFTYAVDRVRRVGDPIPATASPAAARLLLATADGGLFGNQKPLFVDATLKGNPAVAVGGRPNTISPSERAMGGDRAALVPLIFWLQCLMVVAVCVLFTMKRWSVRQAWLVGTPVVIAAMWGAANSAVQLLPNLI